MYVFASKRTKLSEGEVQKCPVLRKLQEDGVEGEVKLPVSAEELACWRTDVASLNAEGLVSAVKVRGQSGSA